jgi:hypothetical protein
MKIHKKKYNVAVITNDYVSLDNKTRSPLENTTLWVHNYSYYHNDWLSAGQMVNCGSFPKEASVFLFSKAT